MTTDDTMNLEIPKVETIAIVPGPPGSSPSLLPKADGTAETTEKRAISPEMTSALINAFVEITKSVSIFVKNAQEDSSLRRQQFPRQIVARMAASDPDFSYIIVNTDYVFVGDKAAQQVVTYDPTFGFKVTFDVFAFTVGTFNLKGDGTWKNVSHISFHALFSMFLTDNP